MELHDLVELGKKHFESRNYVRAEQLFQKILKTGRRYADVLNMLGVIYHTQGKFNNAIESFEEALEINPTYAEASLNLAVLYNDLGDYKKAKELYSRVRKKKSSEMDAILKGKISNMHAHLGDVYRDIGRRAEAIEEYRKALKVSPDFPDIRTKLGISYRENNQKDLAVKELQSTVSESPGCKRARLQLGLTHFTMGHKEKAAKAWKELLARDKDNAVAKVYLRLCGDGKGKK